MDKVTIQLKWSKMIPWEAKYSENVPQESGVYEILVKQSTEEYARRYIGEAENLRDRFGQWLQANGENECVESHLGKHICRFDFALVGNKNDRKDAELALYLKYGEKEYKCNQEEPKGSGLQREVVIVEENPA